ncbi:hypothetical protein ACH5RR_029241 [Cinchona calisaya]|uniref:Uncharacterized protein n=1 Tax=Cinchona calisaya TaxID=153742 RepID=A0ABD2YR34_9GENT
MQEFEEVVRPIKAKENDLLGLIRKPLLEAVVYSLWRERNNGVFSSKYVPAEVIVQKTLDEPDLRVRSMVRSVSELRVGYATVAAAMAASMVVQEGLVAVVDDD